MEGPYTIYRTHHIKGMMLPSYYVYYIYISVFDKLIWPQELLIMATEMNSECDVTQNIPFNKHSLHTSPYDKLAYTTVQH